jgi:dTDP-4-amino-4,6-dideoxygalactose transaminase
MRNLNPFHHQLPVYSPVTFGSILAGFRGAIGLGSPRAGLRSLLLSEYDGRDIALADSGTSALRIAIEGSIQNTGSRIVALPAFSCFDVATAAVGAGASIILYDIRPENLGPDFNSLRSALAAGARTVVVAHLYGVPADLDRSMELCTEFDAILIEDAAQAAAGHWRGRPLGTHGSLGVLSFGRGKGRTGGGGGALIANDERGERILACMNGQLSDRRSGLLELVKLAAQWCFGRPSLYGLPAALPCLGLGETLYKEPWIPQPMSDAAAAALLANWKESKVEEGRRTRWKPPNEIAWGQARFLEDVPEEGSPGWLRFPLMVEQRDALDRSLRRRCGLAHGYPTSLDELPAVAEVLLHGQHQAGATFLARSLITLPTHRYVKRSC